MDSEKLLKGMFKADPTKAVQVVLIFLAEVLLEANAGSFNVEQEMKNINGKHVKMTARFTLEKIKPK